MRAPLIWFTSWILLAIVFIAASTRLPAISFLAFPAVGIAFLIAGVGVGLLAGMSPGRIMDTVLHAASLSIAQAPRFLAVLLIYLLVLALDFFIGSATAKSFLVMPILTPPTRYCSSP